MQIWKYITDIKKQEAMIKPLLWKIIIDTFKYEKDIDISSYLISIKFIRNNIYIKTSKSIINVELQLFNNQIKKDLIVKLTNLWINFDFKDIIYK